MCCFPALISCSCSCLWPGSLQDGVQSRLSWPDARGIRYTMAGWLLLPTELLQLLKAVRLSLGCTMCLRTPSAA